MQDRQPPCCDWQSHRKNPIQVCKHGIHQGHSASLHYPDNEVIKHYGFYLTVQGLGIWQYYLSWVIQTILVRCVWLENANFG